MDIRLKIVIIFSIISLILLAVAWNISNRLAVLYPDTRETPALQTMSASL